MGGLGEGEGKRMGMDGSVLVLMREMMERLQKAFP